MSDRDKHRISRVVTRSGDGGDTGLADGSRLRKDAPRIEAMGDVDELNAVLGVLRGQVNPEQDALLESVQQTLFELGAELALPGTERLTDEDVLVLERALDRLNASLPPLREFILPGGGEAAAWCHFCRTVARRAERRLVAPDAGATPSARRYLNRLSDLLFVLARTLAETPGAESQWQRRTPPPA